MSTPKTVSYEESTGDDDANPCSQGQLIDYLIAESIAEYQDPTITLRVNSITSEDITEIEEMGWYSEIFHDDDETLISLHKK